MVSRIARTLRQFDDAEERRGVVRVVCEACGETIGHYRPARVRQPSVERPLMRLKCTRRGCRHESFITLGEVTLA